MPKIIAGSDRLRQCLVSAIGKVSHLVYVDSCYDSCYTDDRVEMARSLGAEVVDLDLSIPFTADRARNAGFKHLLQVDPDNKYVKSSVDVGANCMIFQQVKITEGAKILRLVVTIGAMLKLA